MLSETILQALTFQMNSEITNSIIYKNFSGIADYLALTGAATWFDKQSQEEYEHFNKFYKYICDQGHIPHLLSVPEQIPEMASIEELFRRTVELEYQTTQQLKQISILCDEVNDDQTYEMIFWYLKEQIEEESTVSKIYKRLSMVMGHGAGILAIDRELGERK